MYAKLIISKKDWETYSPMLDMEESVSGVGEWDTIQVWTAKYVNGIEADLKLCNGSNGPWTEVVWFDDGSEIGSSEVDVRLDGMWELDTENEDYILEVVIECMEN